MDNRTNTMKWLSRRAKWLKKNGAEGSLQQVQHRLAQSLGWANWGVAKAVSEQRRVDAIAGAPTDAPMSDLFKDLW